MAPVVVWYVGNRYRRLDRTSGIFLASTTAWHAYLGVAVAVFCSVLHSLFTYMKLKEIYLV